MHEPLVANPNNNSIDKEARGAAPKRFHVSIVSRTRYYTIEESAVPSLDISKNNAVVTSKTDRETTEACKLQY